MARKVVGLASSANSLMSPFTQGGVSSGFSDARENSVPIQCVAGHPNGQLAVPGQKGFFWATRPGTNVVLQFYAATDADGNPKSAISVNQIVRLRRTSDTQPTLYEQIGAVADSYGETGVPECELDYSRAGYVYPGNIPITGANYWPNATSPTATTNTKNPFSAMAGLTANKLTKLTSGEEKTKPVRAEKPPQIMTKGELWQDSADETVYRNSTDNSNFLMALSGPTSGTYLVRRTSEAIARGKVVYDTTATGDTERKCGIASSTNATACLGRVLGVALQARAANQLLTIQASGELNFGLAGTPGQSLFLSANGDMVTTIPARGTGLLYQKMGILVLAYKQLYIQMSPAIKRV